MCIYSWQHFSSSCNGYHTCDATDPLVSFRLAIHLNRLPENLFTNFGVLIADDGDGWLEISFFFC